MGQTKSKLCILSLPAQSGKTRKAEDEMVYLNETKRLMGAKTDINIWISSNNQTLVSQTDSRIRSDLKMNTYSWMSCSKEKLDVEKLFARIIMGKIDTVIMCANSKRVYHHFGELMDLLNGYEHFVQKVNIWLDEADQYMCLWEKCEGIAHLPCVQYCVFITATPSAIVSKYKNISILPYEFTYGEHYCRLRNCNRVVCDPISSSASHYVGLVVEEHPAILYAGSRIFVPGSNENASHEEISSLLLGKGCSVLILNGESKEIRVPHGIEKEVRFRDEFVWKEEKGYWVLDLKLVLHDGDKELNEVLSRVYYENQLNRYAFGVTGYLCVQRGITFQCLPRKEGSICIHNGFLFDYAIVSNMSNREEAYQTVSRVYGNIGNHPDYKGCTIISTSSNFKKFEHQEEVVVNLAHLAYKNKEPGQRRVEIKESDLKVAASYEVEKDWILYEEECKDREEANKFLKLHGCRACNKENKDPIDERFLLSSTTKKLKRLKYEEVMNELSSWSKLSGFDIHKKAASQRYGRVFISYRDLNDPSSIVFIVRVIVHK